MNLERVPMLNLQQEPLHKWMVKNLGQKAKQKLLRKILNKLNVIESESLVAEKMPPAVAATTPVNMLIQRHPSLTVTRALIDKDAVPTLFNESDDLFVMLAIIRRIHTIGPTLILVKWSDCSGQTTKHLFACLCESFMCAGGMLQKRLCDVSSSELALPTQCWT